MADRDMRPEAREQWSERNQTLRHSGAKRPRDDQALLHDPADYSALGGPENEPAYGRTRSDDGHCPVNPLGGPYDRDTRADMEDRGGYMKLHPGDHDRPDMRRSQRRGPRVYRRPDDRLRDDICELLTDDPDIDATNIDVEVNAGTVTLTGYVMARTQKLLAEERIDRIAGVTDIHNRLRVAAPEGTVPEGGAGSS